MFCPKCSKDMQEPVRVVDSRLRSYTLEDYPSDEPIVEETYFCDWCECYVAVDVEENIFLVYP